ncbi:MAG: transporter [Microscillaceae bacterium]|nr:transporter [Microscillaceae bacterium]MDW8460911.1 transporter [Cytophagales bacterium]
MTEQEYEVLDELYFVQTFAYLAKQLPHYQEIELRNILIQLLAKGWIKCLDAHTKQPLDTQEIDLETNYQTYAYLATKSGLLVHNSK